MNLWRSLVDFLNQIAARWTRRFPTRVSLSALGADLHTRATPSRPGRRVVPRVVPRVIVRGTVIARDLIESPLTATPCVYYRTLVEELRASNAPIPGVRGGIWMATDRDEAIAEFYLDDAGTRAVIAPEGAEVKIPAGAVSGLPEGRRAFEAVLREGDEVEVVGELAEIDEGAGDPYDEARGFRDRPVRLVVRAGARPLTIRRRRSHTSAH